ncbi:hypothetical protein FACS189493_5830 [Spirochaetia bacterium]|nr:hypothetical protein FACS189493_5830 [Spirochaetia bacterium]
MFLRSNVDMQFESANRDMVQNGKADTYSRVQEDISLGSEVVFSGLKIEDVYTEDREKTVRINRRNVSATYTIHYILYVISRADIEDAQNSLNRMDEQTRELAAYQELVETFNDAHLFLKDCDFENAEILYRRAYTTVIGTLAQLEALKTFTDSGFTITDDLRNGYNNTIKEVKSVLENYDPSKPDQIIIRRLQEERDILERQLLAETAELNERLRTETTELRNQLAESAGAVRALNVQYENLYAVLRNLQNNQMAQGDVVSENLLREWVSLLSPAALRNAEQYRVKRGDYLAKIAREKYGSAFYWPIIYAANSSALNLRNPNSLPINVTLRLPALPLDFEERSLMAASDR